VLKISKAALIAATLSLTAVPVVGVTGAMAQDSTTAAPSGDAMKTDLSIPTITAVGSSMDEAALRDVLSGNIGPHAADLAALSATSITIPEIDLSMTMNTEGKSTSSKVVYKDIVLNNVKNGVAESASVGSTSTATSEGSFNFGKLAANAVDFGAILSFYSMVPNTAADQTMKPIYKNFSFEGGTFSGSGASCTFGKVSADEFDARPLKVSFAELMDAANRLDKAGNNPAPDDMGKVVSFITDVFQAFKSTPLSLDGLKCDGNADGKAFNFSIGSLGMDGYAPGTYPALTIKDVTFADDAKDSFKLDSATFKAIDLSAPIAAVEAAGASIDKAWFDTNARKLIPSWAGFSMSGLALDIPNPDDATTRLQANIADFDLTLSDYLNGIPTKISTKASGVDVPLPADSTDDTVKMLQAVGITRLNMNYELSAGWDQASKAINIDKVAFSGNDLGSIALAAVVGNAGDELFDTDPNTEMAASMAVTLKNIKLDIADAGVGDKLVPLMAAGADPATFRSQLAGQAEGAVIAMLGSTDQARDLGAALSDFIQGTKKSVTINVAAKDPAGLPVPVLMQASDNPAIIAPQVDITGTAQ
jgi:hypothetical protein